MSQGYPPDNGNQQPYQQPPQQPYMPGYQVPPGYQSPMMQQPPKKKAKWPFVVGGCGLVAVLAICGIVAASAGIFGATKSSVTSASTSISTDSTQAAPANTNTIAKVGQTITVDQVSCTLVSVKTLAPDDFNKPKAGYQYIVVHITEKNGSTSQVDYNPLDFHVKSTSGNVTDVDFSTPASYTANNILNSGSLDPNGTVTGDIIMQAPLSDAKAELTWAASIFANNTQYGWVLGAY